MRVLCINGDFSKESARENFKFVLAVPEELVEYNIKEIQEKRGKTGYVLGEIFAGFLPNGDEISFDSSRFVRIEEIDTLEEEITEKECLINLQ